MGSVNKAVVLAGGRGTRLGELTRDTNKHLLSVADRPMIAHVLHATALAGLSDVLIVTNADDVPAFRQALGDAGMHGLASLAYTAQPRVGGGVADALAAAEAFVDGQAFVCMLGDNLLADPRALVGFVRRFAAANEPPGDARATPSSRSETHGKSRLLLGRVHAPMKRVDLGIACLEIFGDQAATTPTLTDIVEKPGAIGVPGLSDLAVLGVYGYSASVFNFVWAIQPSSRGEREITELNRRLIQCGAVDYETLSTPWMDCGTPAALEAADVMMRTAR